MTASPDEVRVLPAVEISPDAWKTLSRLLDEGLELPAAERSGWLSCMADRYPALAATLRRLVSAHESAESGNTPLDAPPTLVSPVEPGRAAGERVGPYRLDRRLGVGGMGEVWLAHRDDGAFERDVALKLPLANPLRRELAIRFARERDILARLEHPHIARLYDAGVGRDGQPYLAMEWVHGEPITSACDAGRLDVPARLRLFLQVLGAVQYAHANLVLHRDLKPSNVMVTTEGEARLLDFGIAKLLDGDARALETRLTEQVGRALTPEFASPEQLRGEPLTTASDVYALGVVLFELLTGTRPYRLTRPSAAQLEQAILEREPVRPSTAVTDEAAILRGTTRQRLCRALAGDLDTVVLKALSKEPADRYASAAAFADDLTRHLEGEPVVARRRSSWERLAGFVRKHRWAVAGTAAVLATLLAITTVAVVQARRARAEEARAVAEARRTKTVRDFLVAVLRSADGASAEALREQTLQQAVDGAALRIQGALQEDPEAKMEVLSTLAGVYSSLDQPDRAVPLLEHALQVSEKHHGVPHDSQAVLLSQLANIEMFAGRWDKAERWLTRTEDVLARLHDTSSWAYAHALKMRGNLLRRGNSPDLPKAADALQRALALFRARYPNDPGRLGSLYFLAQTERAMDALGPALAAADEAVQLAEHGSTSAFDRPNARSLRAAIRDTAGDLAGADEDFRVASQGYLASAGATHFLTVQNGALWGLTLLERGDRRDEALALLRTSRDVLTKTRTGLASHAFAAERLGTALVRIGRPQEAIDPLEESRRVWQGQGQTLQRTGATMQLALARLALGEAEAAAGLLDEVLAERRAHPASALYPESEVHLARGELALQTGDLVAARAELTQAIAQSPAPTRESVGRRVRAQALLARLALREGRGEPARDAMAESLRLSELSVVAQSPRVRAWALAARGDVLCSAGGPTAQGAAALAEASSLLAPLVEPDAPALVELRRARARCGTAAPASATVR